jgi:hypothetical protein
MDLIIFLPVAVPPDCYREPAAGCRSPVTGNQYLFAFYPYRSLKISGKFVIKLTIDINGDKQQG